MDFFSNMIQFHFSTECSDQNPQNQGIKKENNKRQAENC